MEDPRTRRLRADHQRMVEIKGRSDLIDFEVVDAIAGSPPEHYVITFKCRGISRIKGERQPVFSEHHQVLIYLSDSYPTDPPKMRWKTPIWHPNIEHTEPYRVCINPTWWAPSRSLDSVVLMLGEMVQYKNYNADPFTFPGVLDHQAAEWAQWAESQGIISPSKPVDDKDLLRPARVVVKEEKPPVKRMVKIAESEKPEAAVPPVSHVRILDSTEKPGSAKPKVKVVE